MSKTPWVHLFECRAVLFDLDGVLVDSTECIEQSWRSWAKRHGRDADQVLRVAHGRRMVEILTLLAPDLPLAAELEALIAFEVGQTDGVYEVPGARELLESLPEGSWAIVTSGVRAVAEARLRRTRLPIPEVLVVADEIDRGKPDPEGYLTAARRLGVPAADCLVVEDAPAGVTAARAAGMLVVALTTTFPVSELQDANGVVDALSRLVVAIEGAGLRVRLTGS